MSHLSNLTVEELEEEVNTIKNVMRSTTPDIAQHLREQLNVVTQELEKIKSKNPTEE